MSGVWQFFFNHDRWNDIYVKNCSLKTQDEWSVTGYRNFYLGMFYAILGIVCEVLYIPFMIAMLKPEFIKHSCYKFMFLIGAMDLFIVPCIGIITGIQCAMGWHFCTSPTFYFFVGALGSSGFYGVSLTCVLLAADRFLEICFPSIAKVVFDGKRIYFWLPIPIVYVLYSFFHIPFVFSTKHFVFFTDPFVEVEGMHGNPAFFSLTFHVVNNFTSVIAMSGIYITLVIVVKIKFVVYGNIYISKLQKLMTWQALCICIEIWISIIVYIYIQYNQTPNFVEILGHIAWICVHGDTPIVYLLLNGSLRREVYRMLSNLVKISSTYTVNFITKAYSRANVVAPIQN